MDATATALAEWLWRTSLQAGVLVLLVLAVQWLLRRRLTAGLRYGLWALVVVRLAMPIVPASSWSLLNWLGGEQPQAVHRPPPPARPVVRVELEGMTAMQPAPVADAAPHVLPAPQRDWRWRLLLAWAAGVALFLARVLWANIRLCRRIRSAQPVEDSAVIALLDQCCRRMGIRRRPQLLQTSAVTMPALMGVLRPRLLVPPNLLEGLSAGEQRFVFLHELAHLKRHDLLADWCLAILHAVHWFNPLVWIAFASLRADRELARDAMVLQLERGESAAYGHTILKLIELIGRRRPLALGAVGILQEKAHLKRRITMIASQRPSTSGQLVLAGLLVPLLAAIAMTGEPRPAQLTPATQPAAALARNAEVRVYDIRDLLVGHVDVDPQAPPQKIRARSEEVTLELIDLIVEVVDRESWISNGGKIGSIKTLNGQLIVAQTADNHVQIVQLLTQLREAGAIQVSIETRLITCDPALVARLLPAPAEKKDAQAGMFLTDEQAGKLLREIQASPSSSLVTAPRVTTFNGQKATIMVGTEHAYIGGFAEKKAPDGKAELSPVTATVQDGIRLELTGTASADRKYVTVSVHPKLTHLEKMTESPAPNAPAGQKLMVQKPQLQSREMNTIVSIPDGATVLLGWQEPAGEKEDPRAQFDLAGQRISTDQILILVRPTLIIQREAEQKQFPLLNTKPRP